MSNLRTILEELVSGKYNNTAQEVKERKLIEAERKIKELILGEEEIVEIICSPCKISKDDTFCTIECVFAKGKFANSIHSAMLKKMGEK